MIDFASFNLRESCHINTNEDGDRFVGVKIDDSQAVVYFPLGYQLPDDDRMLRRDIRTLFGVLSAFGYKEDKVLKGSKFVQAHPVDFPIQAYLDVIDYFMDNNGHYYMESAKKYKSDTKGKINWRRTVKNQKAFIKNGMPTYVKFDVEYQSPLENELITKIHKFCVYHAYKRLGWLYTNQQIVDPGFDYNEGFSRIFIQELRKKYNDTNKDRDKKLFKSMIAMIEFIDNRKLDKNYYFGTDNFEYIWEKLIDKIFGIANKDDYFPRAVWVERDGSNKCKETHAFMPDTIMIYNDKIYILDAKYYRYGDTHKPEHLPDSSSINKQITYGDFISSLKNPKDPSKKLVDINSLFNAFLMPYDSTKNVFSSNGKFANVAEATGEWRSNTKLYEKIQGIVVDVRYIMHNYAGEHDEDKKLLSKSIEQYILSH